MVLVTFGLRATGGLAPGFDGVRLTGGFAAGTGGLTPGVGLIAWTCGFRALTGTRPALSWLP